MSKDNAALKAQPIASVSRGIHLAYSRSWQGNEPGSPTMPERTQLPQTRPVRESHTMATLSLGAAAASAPLIWIGHAILHWLHVL